MRKINFKKVVKGLVVAGGVVGSYYVGKLIGCAETVMNMCLLAVSDGNYKAYDKKKHTLTQILGAGGYVAYETLRPGGVFSESQSSEDEILSEEEVDELD